MLGLNLRGKVEVDVEEAVMAVVIPEDPGLLITTVMLAGIAVAVLVAVLTAEEAGFEYQEHVLTGAQTLG